MPTARNVNAMNVVMGTGVYRAITLAPTPLWGERVAAREAAPTCSSWTSFGV
jgi:hypothetical protein